MVMTENRGGAVFFTIVLLLTLLRCPRIIGGVRFGVDGVTDVYSCIYMHIPAVD